jgi:hypothetical protein
MKRQARPYCRRRWAAAQGRVEQLLDRGIEGIQVRMEDGGCRFHPDRSPAKFRGWLANPPAGKAGGDCFGQSLDFGLQVGICDERRAQRRAWIPTANRNSRVYVRFKQNSGGGLGLCRY